MLIASAKKKENIAEYLLYMWQIEDLIRANYLDIDRIQHTIIDRYTSVDDEQRHAIRQWYESLIDMMRREGVKTTGHLQLNINTLNELAAFHQQLLREPRFAPYSAEFYKTLPLIVELRAKAGDKKVGELETCFNALYGVLLLRLQGKEITQQTLEASKQISRLLAMLSKYYKEETENPQPID